MYSKVMPCSRPRCGWVALTFVGSRAAEISSVRRRTEEIRTLKNVAVFNSMWMSVIPVFISLFPPGRAVCDVDRFLRQVALHEAGYRRSSAGMFQLVVLSSYQRIPHRSHLQVLCRTVSRQSLTVRYVTCSSADRIRV